MNMESNKNYCPAAFDDSKNGCGPAAFQEPKNNYFPPTFSESKNGYASAAFGMHNSEGQGKACSTCESSSRQSRKDGSETHVYFEACDGVQSICVNSSCEDQMMPGRVLNVTPTLQNVCPGRRSAVGLMLTEVDENGAEYARGFRAISVPAHHGKSNCDVQLDPVRFILPEDMSLQRRRHFVCRVQHHYLDADSIWS